MDESQDLSLIGKDNEEQDEQNAQQNRGKQPKKASESSRIEQFDDKIEPFDFGFDTSRTSNLSSMNLEYTNSYTFQPSTSYMASFTTGDQNAGPSTSWYEPNRSQGLQNSSVFGMSPKRQVGIVSPNVTTSQDDPKGFLESSKSNILSIINLLNQNVLSYPFIVFRRQAQINNRTSSYHLYPFSVVPFLVRVQANQGATAIFKGLSSSLLTHVILIGSESLFFNLLQLPIEASFIQEPNIETIVKHLALKALSYAVVTPFLCSSAVESVQSLIVSESSGPLDCITEGLARLFHFKNDRKFGFFQLVIPTVSYHLIYYVMFSVTRELLSTYVFKSKTGSGDKKRKPEEDDEMSIVNELKSSLFANIITDAVLYPFQTILYRLFLQGTRTLIDNVDYKTAVIPLISNYESAGDCYDWILTNEGTAGLYKGFGALVLQYGVQASLIELANYCIEACSAM